MLALPPLRLANDGSEARFTTRVELAWDEAGLEVIFTCQDEDAWSTFLHHDDPLWQEEAVEVFLAVGAADPQVYYEVELSPRGVTFDARVENPDSLRATMKVDTGWSWQGLAAAVRQLPERQDWQARLFLPWQGLGQATPPPILRANFYRIERPRQGQAEFSCWSPTRKDPPDFHQPQHFGTLLLEGLSASEEGPEPIAKVPRRPR